MYLHQPRMVYPLCPVPPRPARASAPPRQTSCQNGGGSTEHPLMRTSRMPIFPSTGKASKRKASAKDDGRKREPNSSTVHGSLNQRLRLAIVLRMDMCHFVRYIVGVFPSQGNGRKGIRAYNNPRRIVNPNHNIDPNNSYPDAV